MKELKIGGFDHMNSQPDISARQEEINTLKLDKLSNRVTIISIIIPCIIGAVLIFAYLGMKETVIDVNKKKQNKIIEITKQFGEKTNSFDLKLAKINSMLEKTLPRIEEKIKKLDASVSKLSSTKADKKKVKSSIAKLNKDNSKYKALTGRIEKKSIENQKLFNESMDKLEARMADLGKKLDAQLIKMDEYETLVATTSKNLSILEKRFDEFKKNALTNKTLVAKLDRMNNRFNAKLDKLELKLSKSSKKSKAGSAKKIVPKGKTTPGAKGKSSQAPIVEEVLDE